MLASQSAGARKLNTGRPAPPVAGTATTRSRVLSLRAMRTCSPASAATEESASAAVKGERASGRGGGAATTAQNYPREGCSTPAGTPLRTVNHGDGDLVGYAYGYPPQQTTTELLDPAV